MSILFPHISDIDRPQRPLFSLTGVAAGHVALIALIATVTPPDAFLNVLNPMSVRLVEIPSELPPPKPAELPKPKKALHPPPPPSPLLASTTPREASPVFNVPPSPPIPIAATRIAAATIAVAPALVSITLARFDADYLDNPSPAYPSASRRLGEQGIALLRVYVSAQGLAETVELKASSGFARLDQAAQEAVSRWRFVPARRGEQAVAAWVQVPITFQLDK
jgi:protein TonB